MIPESSREESKIISVDAELTASSKFIPNKTGHKFVGKSPSFDHQRNTVKRNNFLVKSNEENEDIATQRF